MNMKYSEALATNALVTGTPGVNQEAITDDAIVSATSGTNADSGIALSELKQYAQRGVGATYTVGAGYDYETLDDFLGNSGPLPDIPWTEVTMTGTIAVNANSHTVVGTGTLFTTELGEDAAARESTGSYYINISNTGTPKYCAVRAIISDTELLLDSPAFSSVSGVAAEMGYPIFSTVKVFGPVLDTTGGSGISGTKPQMNLIMDFSEATYYHTYLNLRVQSSGNMIIKNISNDSGFIMIGTTTAPDRASVASLYLINCIINNYDWDVIYNTNYARFYSMNCRMRSYFDVFMPWVTGRVESSGCTWEARKINNESPYAVSAQKNNTSVGGVLQRYVGDRFVAQPIGLPTTDATRCLWVSGGPSVSFAGWALNHDIVYTGCMMQVEVPEGADPSPKMNMIDAQFMLDSDVVFSSCSFTVDSETIPAEWYFIFSDNAALDPPGVRPRMSFINCSTPDLPIHPDFWLRWELKELSGTFGIRTASVTTGTVPVVEVEPIRATTNHVGPMTGNLTIPDPAGNGFYPNGAVLEFVFTEDAAAGHTVTWGSSFAVQNWTDSVITTDANKTTMVHFEYSNGTWLQTSRDNYWV